MEPTNYITKPSKDEQKIAIASYDALAAVIKQLSGENDHPEIEIEETQERIKIPFTALKLLGDILEAMGKGVPFSMVPIATEVTTQKAAEILGCSRPHLVKLLETGKIDFVKVGKHRRIKLDDVLRFKAEMKKAQKRHLVDIMKADQESNLYDS